MLSYYDVLGVAPWATDIQIKKAYRVKASEHHPDRPDGDPAAMSAINDAYAVLSDPRKRLVYDETGEDSRKPINVMARDSLTSAISAVLDGEMEDIVVGVRQVLEMERNELAGKLATARRKLIRFEARARKINLETNVKLVHVELNRAIAKLEASIENTQESLQVNAEARRQFDGYVAQVQIGASAQATAGSTP